MKIVALLPFKANSERVVGKNFKILGSKPLYKWMLDKLLEIDQINKIVINTDARKLLKEKGFKENKKILIRDRKIEIQGDYVSMNKIIEDDINNIHADIFFMTHTTNPFLSKSTIEKAIRFFIDIQKDKKFDSMFSVEKMQDRFYDKTSSPVNHDPKKLERTQDLEPLYKENSNFYLFTKESFLRRCNRIGDNPYMYETPKIESIDIDTPEDWGIAEQFVEALR